MEKQCSKCNSVYEVTKHKLIVRDKDSLECDICGTTYMSWNGVEMWSDKLIRKGTALPSTDKLKN